MEITAFKVKSCNLPILTFGHSYLNICSYRSPIDANSIFLDSWPKDLSTLRISTKTDVIRGRYDFSKMKTEFYQQTGFVKNESKLRSEVSKPTSKFLFQQFSSSKTKHEDFMQGYFSFFRKIVIEILNCKLST
jgi:hypothetical protein